jgi:hypothetical protein
VRASDAQAVSTARALALGRLALGIAMAVAPRAATSPWIGADAERPGTQVAVRAFGAREAFLGFLGYHVAGRPGVGRRTISAMAALDTFDAAITIAARRALPASGVAVVTAIAGTSAIAHVWASRGLPDS